MKIMLNFQEYRKKMVKNTRDRLILAGIACQYLPIFADIRQYSPIFADICRYMSIFADIRRYLPFPSAGGGPLQVSLH